MGAVYKARDREIGRIIALKVIRPELAGRTDILDRFKQELILARQVTHRNVIRIFDLGTSGDIKFITMEFVEGSDLSHVLHERRLTVKESVAVIRQVCSALESAHAEHVIHRDLKPQNIMVGENGRVWVMDFGLARMAAGGNMTQTGAMLGTPGYMSPEQVCGTPVDGRSDIFSVGVILYELLAGRLPYEAETVFGSLVKRTQSLPPAPTTVDPTIPPALNGIVMKCLAIKPEDRFQTAGEMVAALDDYAGGKALPSVLLTPPPPPMVPAKVPARSRNRRWVIGAAMATVAVLAGLAYVGFRRITAPTGPPKPITVLVADFQNSTGDPMFDDALEPMFNLALEGASFINAFNRGQARKLAAQLPHPTKTLDEQSARLIAMGQGLGAVVTGSLTRRGDDYKLSVEALDAVTGKSLASAELKVPNKDELFRAVPKLAAPIRKALGDTVPESAQLSAAAGGFTASSLEVVHQYGVGMEQLFAGKMSDALQSFSKAAELDPNFARAYSGMSAAAGNLGHVEDAEKYSKLALEHVDRMTERERYRIRGLYFLRTGNWDKCIEEYSQLTAQYPSDNIGYNNLAGCYAHTHDMVKTLQVARRAVQISPKNVMARTNLALYACYAGEFDTCEREAHELLKANPSFDSAFVVLGYAQIGQGHQDQAAQTYSQLAKTGARGTSLAASGLANLAIYEGRLVEAAQILEKNAAANLAQNERDAAADNFITLAYAQLLRGNKQPALAAAEHALENSQSAKIRLLAGRTFIEAGEAAKAQPIIEGFGSDVKSDPQAYAKLLQGEARLKSGKAQLAVLDFRQAKRLSNDWMSAFDLGRAYLDAEAFAEADSEFESCIKRRGEVMELFMDDMPTSAYYPPVFYYQGKAREGLKSPGAADCYRTYDRLRAKAGEDPLLPDIRRRLTQLGVKL
jgi:tetratricopeptide (TPR) repeat protein